VVGLTKQHSLVPIELTVVRMAGTGEESVFLGVVRRAASTDDSVVRVSGWKGAAA